MKENIKAIFLDLGGTFRVVDEENYPFIRQARERIKELCGTDMTADVFYEFLNKRYDGYRNWALKFTWPWPALPLLVVMMTTPLAAREPYREAAAASFSTVTDSMS